jgi:hypothetical protein
MNRPTYLPILVCAAVMLSTNTASGQCNEFVRRAMKTDGLSKQQVQRICDKAQQLASTPQGHPASGKEAKFLGEWQGIPDEWNTIKIYKTGDTYLVETHFPNQSVHKYPATFRDGQLKISGDTSVAYLDTTGHILLSGGEYERKK